MAAHYVRGVLVPNDTSEEAHALQVLLELLASLFGDSTRIIGRRGHLAPHYFADFRLLYFVLRKFKFLFNFFHYCSLLSRLLAASVRTAKAHIDRARHWGVIAPRGRIGVLCVPCSGVHDTVEPSTEPFEFRVTSTVNGRKP